MDYGRYKYEQGKKDSEARKKQKGGDLKGIYLRPGTDDHDLGYKLKNALKFLGEGDKVKITVRFRSREMSHPEFAKRLLDKVVEAAGETASIEKPPGIEGRTMTMILAPK
jgi:translation initiation factor IF-3